MLSFRARGLQPEIWNAETGTVTPQAVYEETKDKRTNLPVWLGPYGTIVVVFRRWRVRTWCGWSGTGRRFSRR